jgi:hypothetical protein
VFAAQNISNMLYALAALKITPLDVLLKVLSLLALLVHTKVLTRRRPPEGSVYLLYWYVLSLSHPSTSFSRYSSVLALLVYT